jgi:hypothetical protein
LGEVQMLAPPSPTEEIIKFRAITRHGTGIFMVTSYCLLISCQWFCENDLRPMEILYNVLWHSLLILEILPLQ